MDVAQNGTDPHMSYNNYMEMISTALNLSGIAANVLIISTILSSRSLQTRSYLLLMNWSIFDILFKISTDKYMKIIINNYPIKKEMICIARSLEMIFLFGEIIFMLALISNWALKSRMNNLRIVFIFYAIIVSCLVTVLFLCMYRIMKDLIGVLVGITYLVLLIVVIAKSVNRIRKAMGDPLSPESVKRLNVASIYTYTMLFLFVTVIIAYEFYVHQLHFWIDFIMFITILIPCFIHLYLTKADEVYKANFLALIFCRPQVDYPTENVNSINES
ncbi:PREDICTED: uncharacterized protein LOC108569940 isoform X12 [Nicrophorus vespilloides]|uniref:Uncharacterized protein LOC108569940 isoform X12 n=1 Tax=Nicrophorus vespilloides TaxID=110193 RepID=A0ABM1NK56_NICVS|nr:PREDICTED: uncharacterized protein LOC108569940 isoform X12 [Nicrophorus vespilloides]